MSELQLARMEREAPCRIALSAIFSISDNRMTDRGQLNADLMLAPAFQRELEQRLVTAFLQHSIMRDRQLATLRDPACDVRVTNGTAIRYDWAPPSDLAKILLALQPTS